MRKRWLLPIRLLALAGAAGVGGGRRAARIGTRLARNDALPAGHAVGFQRHRERSGCGYFVATVLKDAGFQMDRYQLIHSGRRLHPMVHGDRCFLAILGDLHA
jgi:hypothetical protein